MNEATRRNVLLVYPRFGGASFWNYRATCELLGARHSAAPLGLITVAALLPAGWGVRLVDCNIEEVHPGDFAWADLVMTGGMLPQQPDALRIIGLAKAAGKPVVVGGPDVTGSPGIYAAADFRLLGEAEEVLADLLAAWLGGAQSGLFKATRFPDVTRSPVPRFDLLKLDQYLHVGIQYSRGCPFDCEFCNVIDLNGRVPRSKATAQVFRELDTLHALGYRGHVDFVDDNLIGSRRALKPFLRELRRWLEVHDWPFEFTTEASLDLAEDEELLQLLRDGNFFAIFVGLETPDAATLIQANKRHNTRSDMVASIHKIHRAGIFVNAGFIVGFDAEPAHVAAAMVDCIEAANIPVCMVGLLYALPGTRLAHRLREEGRLQPDAHTVLDGDADQCTSGLNFDTVRPRAEVLRDYKSVLERIYAPRAYFGRARRACRQLDRSAHRLRQPPRHVLRELRAFGRMAWRLGVLDRQVRAEWWRSVGDALLHYPSALKIVASFAALYVHLGPYSAELAKRLDFQIAIAESEELRKSA